jgi:hypothetical protein
MAYRRDPHPTRLETEHVGEIVASLRKLRASRSSVIPTLSAYLADKRFQFSPVLKLKGKQDTLPRSFSCPIWVSSITSCCVTRLPNVLPISDFSYYSY